MDLVDQFLRDMGGAGDCRVGDVTGEDEDQGCRQEVLEAVDIAAGFQAGGYPRLSQCNLVIGALSPHDGFEQPVPCCCHAPFDMGLGPHQTIGDKGQHIDCKKDRVWHLETGALRQRMLGKHIADVPGPIGMQGRDEIIGVEQQGPEQDRCQERIGPVGNAGLDIGDPMDGTHKNGRKYAGPPDNEDHHCRFGNAGPEHHAVAGKGRP